MDLSLLTPSFILACVALVLSQISPLMNYIRRQKVSILIPDSFTLYNYLGKPSIDLFLSIQNNGTKSVSISQIELILKGKDFFYKIPSRTYYPHNRTETDLIIGGLLVKPDEQWSEMVRFYQLLDDEEEELISEIMNDFESKQRKNPNVTPEVEENIVIKAKKFFDKNFKLKSGKYQLFVVATSESNKEISKNGFTFKLFDKCIRDLKKVTDDYKYGEGLTYGSNDVCVPRLISMTNEMTEKEYEKLKTEEFFEIS